MGAGNGLQVARSETVLEARQGREPPSDRGLSPYASEYCAMVAACALWSRMMSGSGSSVRQPPAKESWKSQPSRHMPAQPIRQALNCSPTKWPPISPLTEPPASRT